MVVEDATVISLGLCMLTESTFAGPGFFQVI